MRGQSRLSQGRGWHLAGASALPFGAERFAALWARRATTPPSPDGATVFANLLRRLEEPARHFHNLDHIRECVELVDEVAPGLREPDAVEMGLWFHDAVYVPGAADNERRSAELFVALSHGVATAFRHRVARNILATRHAALQYDDRAYVVDIDLAGLGAPWEDFIEKGDLLRRELAGQSDATYYRAQVGFLNGLIRRPAIYSTGHFRERFEAVARGNLQRLLDLRAAQGYATTL